MQDWYVHGVDALDSKLNSMNSSIADTAAPNAMWRDPARATGMLAVCTKTYLLSSSLSQSSSGATEMNALKLFVTCFPNAIWYWILCSQAQCLTSSRLRANRV
eukprot:scpid102368/ scgid31920/ 